jgi:hypothetical protein
MVFLVYMDKLKSNKWFSFLQKVRKINSFNKSSKTNFIYVDEEGNMSIRSRLVPSTN